ncbi:hypothetical protein EDC01DRAFT_369386 [Geopyxis carbonaria]|nr:hypothetical protein EDC01DRAFT_369386 [Geopyxis carbonaria]
MDRRPPAPPHPRGAHPRNLSHFIQFYSAEVALFDAISAFVLPTFFSSEHAAIIVATKPHLDSLSIYLRTNNLAPEALKKREQLYLTPAEPILEHLTPGGKVSEERFMGYFGPLFAKIQKKYPRLLVYGELVNMLCDKNRHTEAYDLEQLWEAFLAGKDASLLCGYDMNVFASDGLEDVFQKICRSHSHVTPVECVDGGTRLMGGGPGDQQMVLAMLQQKSLRLSAEMNKRVVLENALQSTLDHLGNRPQDAIQIRDKNGEAAHINMSPVGIVAATTTNGITEYYVNAKFLELSGLTDRMVRTDGGWVAAVHYQDRERTSHHLRLADGKTRRCEYRFVLPNGTLRWISGESVAKETGYVHSAVDISQFRIPQPTQAASSPSSRSRTTSIPPDSGLNSGALGHPALEFRKRSFGTSNRNSGSETSGRSEGTGRSDGNGRSGRNGGGTGSTTGSGSRAGTDADQQTLMSRGSPRDKQISRELSAITRTLWDILCPPILLGEAYPTTPEVDVDNRLASINGWFLNLPGSFHPHMAEFGDSNDSLQQANLRLAHVAYLACTVVVTRLGLVRAVERGDFISPPPQLSADQQPPRSRQGKPKDEGDDFRYAETCIDAAIKACKVIRSMTSLYLSSSSSSAPGSPPRPVEPTAVRSICTCRVVINTFFIAALTVLLHVSVQPDHPPKIPQNEALLDIISHTMSDFCHLVPDLAQQYNPVLSPFITSLRSMKGRPAYTQRAPLHGHHHQRRPSAGAPPETPPAPATRVAAELTEILKKPWSNVAWVPFQSPCWVWKDLLTDHHAPPSGNPIDGSRSCSPSVPGTSGTLTVLDDDRDKRVRRTDEIPYPLNPTEEERKVGEVWGMSKELEALFGRSAQ